MKGDSTDLTYSLNLHKFFNSNTHLNSIIDNDGSIQWVSDTWYTLLNINENLLLKKSYTEFMHPQDISTTNERFAEYINSDFLYFTPFVNRFFDINENIKYVKWLSSTPSLCGNFHFSPAIEINLVQFNAWKNYYN